MLNGSGLIFWKKNECSDVVLEWFTRNSNDTLIVCCMNDSEKQKVSCCSVCEDEEKEKRREGEGVL